MATDALKELIKGYFVKNSDKRLNLTKLKNQVDSGDASDDSKIDSFAKEDSRENKGLVQTSGGDSILLNSEVDTFINSVANWDDKEGITTMESPSENGLNKAEASFRDLFLTKSGSKWELRADSEIQEALGEALVDRPDLGEIAEDNLSDIDEKDPAGKEVREALKEKKKGNAEKKDLVSYFNGNKEMFKGLGIEAANDENLPLALTLEDTNKSEFTNGLRQIYDAARAAKLRKPDITSGDDLPSVEKILKSGAYDLKYEIYQGLARMAGSDTEGMSLVNINKIAEYVGKEDDAFKTKVQNLINSLVPENQKTINVYVKAGGKTFFGDLLSSIPKDLDSLIYSLRGFALGISSSTSSPEQISESWKSLYLMSDKVPNAKGESVDNPRKSDKALQQAYALKWLTNISSKDEFKGKTDYQVKEMLKGAKVAVPNESDKEITIKRTGKDDLKLSVLDLTVNGWGGADAGVREEAAQLVLKDLFKST